MKREKKVIYVADDGQEFETPEKCLSYERQIAEQPKMELKELIENYNEICRKIAHFKHPYSMGGTSVCGRFKGAEEGLVRVKDALTFARLSQLPRSEKRALVRIRYNEYCAAYEHLSGLKESYNIMIKHRNQLKTRIKELRSIHHFARLPEEGI